MRTYVTLLVSSLFLFACAKGDKGSAVLKISVPKAPAAAGVSAKGQLPSDRKLCYGVNVTGPGIADNSNTCSATTGITAGFLEAGSTTNLQVEVPKGSGRKIEIFAYTFDPGSSGACPQMPKNLSNISTRTYLVGKLENVSLVKDSETVTIFLDFPGLASHLAAQLGLPSQCTVQDTTKNAPGFRTVTSTAEVSGSGFVLKGRVGRTTNGVELTGGGYSLRLKQ